MTIEFEWDTKKENSNIKKHGISFVTAAELLLKKHYKARSDRNGEERFLTIGEINERVIIVVYTIRDQKHRIISARRASKNEEKKYRNNG